MRFYYHNCILFSLVVRYNHRRNPTTPVLVADRLYSDVEHMQRIHKDMSYKSSRNPELERYDCGGTCDVKE